MKDTYIVELREHISKKKRPYPSTVEDFTIVSQTPPPPLLCHEYICFLCIVPEIQYSGEIVPFL